MTEDRIRRVAIHEAAHATCARLLRLPNCGEASVEEPHAHAKFSCDHGARSIAALMAGSAGEVVLFGDYDRAGGRVDWERIHKRLDRLGYTDGGEALWTYTTNLLQRQAPLLTFLAHKLKRARVLDGGEIDRIVALHRWPDR
jgi:hypothetical protein